MKIIPAAVISLDAVFLEPLIIDELYIFSYTNSLGNRLRLFSNRISILTEKSENVVLFSRNTRCSSHYNFEDVSDGKIIINDNGQVLEFKVDTKSNNFFDIFPIFKIINRCLLVFQSRLDKLI